MPAQEGAVPPPEVVERSVGAVAFSCSARKRPFISTPPTKGRAVGGCRVSQFETDVLEGMCFQGVETRALSTRGRADVFNLYLRLTSPCWLPCCFLAASVVRFMDPRGAAAARRAYVAQCRRFFVCSHPHLIPLGCLTTAGDLTATSDVSNIPPAHHPARAAGRRDGALAVWRPASRRYARGRVAARSDSRVEGQGFEVT